MKQELSPNLRPIYDLELALGNAVLQTRESSHAAFPLTVVFKEALHRAQVEANLDISPPVKWYSCGNFAGYVTEDTRQSLQGPAPSISELAHDARQKLSPNLQSICDLELSLGNTVIRIDEPAGDRCPLAIIFKKPLHKAEIASHIELAPDVKWWENRDPHYPIEGGYMCEQTRHALAGPLR